MNDEQFEYLVQQVFDEMRYPPAWFELLVKDMGLFDYVGKVLPEGVGFPVMKIDPVDSTPEIVIETPLRLHRHSLDEEREDDRSENRE
ncbi:MAG: hypothetical protein ACYDCC_12190 [Actinomycetota bacterium]